MLLNAATLKSYVVSPCCPLLGCVVVSTVRAATSAKPPIEDKLLWTTKPTSLSELSNQLREIEELDTVVAIRLVGAAGISSAEPSSVHHLAYRQSIIQRLLPKEQAKDDFLCLSHGPSQSNTILTCMSLFSGCHVKMLGAFHALRNGSLGSRTP
jgi:hypothetical protein